MQTFFIPSVLSQGAINNGLFVDGATTVPTAQQTGSILSPFRTITQAIDAIPQATTDAEAKNVGLVIIAPGDYDEDLAVDITGRRILLLSWGPWGLGVFDGADWGPTTTRNITVTGSGGNLNGIRPAFGIGTFEQLGRRFSTHQSYVTGARISGDIVFDCPGGSVEVDLECEVFGNVSTLNAPILQTYLYNGRYRGLVDLGTNGQLQHAQGVRFNDLVTVGAYSHLEDCRLDAGFSTGSASNAGLRPDGFVGCEFRGGTFDGPLGSFRLDSYTDYWARTNNIPLVGGATKVLLDPQGKIFVRNVTGLTISKGQVVYINGYNSPTDLPTVALANASVLPNAHAIGLALNDIPNNSNGWVIYRGELDGLNTSAFADADTIYLGLVAGTITDVAPMAPNYTVGLGYVLDAAGGTNGKLWVEVDPPLRDSGKLMSFGANMTLADQGSYFAVNGEANTAVVGALDPESEAVMAGGGTLSRISWNSDTAAAGPGPARTEFNVLRNGLTVFTVNCTGARGTVSATSMPVFAAGDRIAVEYFDGDAPGRTNLKVLFS